MESFIEYLKEAKTFKKYFHVSFDGDLDKKPLKPKVSSVTTKRLEQFKKNPKLPIKSFIDRQVIEFSMCPTIEGCINTIPNLAYLLMKSRTLHLHVYKNATKIDNFISSQLLTKSRLSYDSWKTHEIWVTEEEIELKHLGSFNISIENIDFNKTIGYIPFKEDSFKRDIKIYWGMKKLPNFKL